MHGERKYFSFGDIYRIHQSSMMSDGFITDILFSPTFTFAFVPQIVCE
jgi:hypothetical protein